MTARWVAFLTWAAVAAASMYWALKLSASPSPLPAHAHVAAAAPRLAGDLQRVLGAGAPAATPSTEAAAAPPPPDPRFSLIGVVAPRPGTSAREGLALIALDEQPAKAFRVGSVVDGSLVLLAVSARGASLGPRGGPPSVVLELPDVPAPATGTPPAAEGIVPAPLPTGRPRAAPAVAPGMQPGRPIVPVPAVVPAVPPVPGAQADAEPRPGQAATPLPRAP